MKRTPLRRYSYMKPRSDKVVKAQPSFQAVYDEVDRRSEGRCEWTDRVGVGGPVISIFMDRRCPRRGTDHHHTVKPRRSPLNHRPEYVIHLCAGHHTRCSWPYNHGRGKATALGNGRFYCELVYAKDKFAARGQG